MYILLQKKEKKDEIANVLQMKVTIVGQSEKQRFIFPSMSGYSKCYIDSPHKCQKH